MEHRVMPSAMFGLRDLAAGARGDSVGCSVGKKMVRLSGWEARAVVKCSVYAMQMTRKEL